MLTLFNSCLRKQMITQVNKQIYVARIQCILEEEQLKKTRNIIRKAHRNRSKKIVKKS